MRNKFFKFFNSRFFLIFALICFTYILGAQSDKYFKWIHPEKISSERPLSIHTDGTGYYAYLPQWYIYKSDKKFSFLHTITPKYPKGNFGFGIAFKSLDENGLNKCFIGTAICSSPLFLITHAVNELKYGSGDGYSRSYQLTVALNAILYWLIGCIAIYLLFQKLKIPRFWTVLILAGITFGTNLNFYIVYFPSFSHAFSFGVISWFVYVAYLFGQNKSIKSFLWMCFFFGLLFSIRPTNSLVMLILPFFFNGLKDFWLTILDFIKNKWIYCLLGIGIITFFIFLQLNNVHSQIGEWKLDIYSDEHFEFLTNPQIFNVLFSYRKGFFIYSPFMVFSLLGIYVLIKENRFLGVGWVITLIVILYITASWWCWWYGGGLGLRPMIDILILWALPIGFLVQKLNSFLKSLFFICSIGLIFIYQIFQIQFNENILSYDIIRKDQFWDVFMKTDKRYNWSYNYINEKLPSKNKIHIIKREFQYFLVQNSIKIKTIVDPFEEIKPLIFHSPNNHRRIIIHFNGKIKISKPESNPILEASFYKNGNQIKKSVSLLGPKIDELNEFQVCKVYFNSRLNLTEIDSIKLSIGKGEVPTSFKNLKVGFYSFVER